MSRDDVAKVLDLERPFESGRKEAAEGSDDGGEEGEEEGVDEEGVEGDRLLHVEQPSPRGQCLHRFEGFQHENIALAYLSTRRDFGDGDGDGEDLWKGVLLLSEESRRLARHCHPFKLT